MQATLARLNAPIGILADGASGYFIVDRQNSVIRRVFANGTIRTEYGRGGSNG